MKAGRVTVLLAAVRALMLSCAGGGGVKIESSAAGFDRFLVDLAQEYIELKPYLTASTGSLDHLGIANPPLTLPVFADGERFQAADWKSSNFLKFSFLISD